MGRATPARAADEGSAAPAAPGGRAPTPGEGDGVIAVEEVEGQGVPPKRCKTAWGEVTIPLAAALCTGSSNSHLRELGAHFPDRYSVIRSAEDRRSGDERVGARFRDRGDVVAFHAAVDFEHDRAPALLLFGVDTRAHRAQLVERVGDERLPAKAGIDRHDQHEVE